MFRHLFGRQSMTKIVIDSTTARGSAPAPVGQDSVEADPLPSWNDGAAKRSIVEFVAMVTRMGGAEFVPPVERVAVFDNDGTLWAEQPLYFQGLFVLDRIRSLEPQHPEWRDSPLFTAAIENDLKTLVAGGLPSLVELVMATHAGMTTEEIERTVKE
jgi:hypothetical protein